jgi:hypothetical protein
MELPCVSIVTTSGWRVRLSVRTWPSQGRKTGSIPVRATNPATEPALVILVVRPEAAVGESYASISNHFQPDQFG